MNLHQPLHVLPGVGPKSAEKYAKLGIENLQDLLLYFPFRYEDFKTKRVLELEDGEKAVLSGQVVTPASVQYYGFKRNRLRFSLKQGEVVFAVNFFNQPYLADKIELGATLAVFGKWDRAKASLTGMKVLAQVEDDLQPVYRLAQGISQAALVKVIKTAFDQGLDLLIEENLPQSLLDKYKLMSRCQAVRAMHFPKDLAEYKQALRRIKFEELFYFQMQLQTLKSENRVQGSGLVLNWSQEKVTEVKENLPFALTQAQDKSLQEILADMKSDHHMNRLLQGDVGSGKTVVAGLAMFAAVTAGYQAALMVPTEILAEQHFESLQSLFPDLKLALLTGSLKAAEKREVLETIAKGEADLIIGTHALIQEGVNYARLGLIIIDEQHRFGVGQRRILREKGDNPDVLMMTATPIPRTLAITAFGDMDVSIIDQMPAGRKPIVTRWIKHEQLPQVLTWLEGEIQKGHPEYQKQLEAAWDNVNEFFTTLMSAYISEQNIQDLYNSGKIVDFKTLCQYTEKAIKSNKDWENVKLDIFLQWQRKPSPNQTRTFLEIDTYAISSILHNKFICKAMEGTFKEDRTKTHLRYFNENGVEHIFKRGSYWLSEGAPYLNEQNLQYAGGSSNGGGRSVENDLFGSAATVPVGNSQADNDDLPF